MLQPSTQRIRIKVSQKNNGGTCDKTNQRVG